MRVRQSLFIALLGSALALSACDVSDQANDAATIEPGSGNRVADLEAELNEVRAANELLKAAARGSVDAPADAPMDDIPLADQAMPAPVDMCYKDYCPCDPPQGGPDSVLCDQLEAGIPVEVDMMIAGRGMREGRRQLEEIDRGDF